MRRLGVLAMICGCHTAEPALGRPPAGFTVVQRGDDVVAYQEGVLVGVVRVPHSKRAFEAAAARYVEGDVAWSAPTTERIDAWHAVVTALGTAPDLAVSARVIYPGVDASGSGRAGSDLQGNPGDLVWLAVAETPEKADALVTGARASRRMLVDHACECSYDCDRRPPR